MKHDDGWSAGAGKGDWFHSGIHPEQGEEDGDVKAPGLAWGRDARRRMRRRGWTGIDG